jgi:alginate O-acetyltransferase complex protein AlgI
VPRLNSRFVTAWSLRILTWGTFVWLIGPVAGALVLAAAIVVQVTAVALHANRTRSAVAMSVVAVGVGAHLALLMAAARAAEWPAWLPVGLGVFACHAVSYLSDVNSGVVNPRHHLTALLYVFQLPVFPAGPLSRFSEFQHQLAHTEITMGAFSYGVRRIVTGLIKVFLIGAPLGTVAGRIFALRVTRLSTDAAWLGAVCAALEIYYYLSGFSDIGVGVGRTLGFRHLENFRRPFTADSIREFWRRWNVTLITWLRDYVSLPIAGHDRPTPRLYLLTIIGFLVIGGWHRPTWQVIPWAVYFASWLALEALGLGAALPKLPKVLRHAYVVLVMIFGWMLLRVSGPGHLLGYTEALLGFSVVDFGGSAVYLTSGFVTALVSAVVFAGPLVGWISRWRVSVDAAVASLIMMFAATGILVYHLVNEVRRLFVPTNSRH